MLLPVTSRTAVPSDEQQPVAKKCRQTILGYALEGKTICKPAFMYLSCCGVRIIKTVLDNIQRGAMPNWQRGKYVRSQQAKAK